MSWYYANGEKQVGPFSDPDFEQLVREGTVAPATLVWREGMGQWVPWEAAAASTPKAPFAAPAPAPPTAQAVCTECRRPVAPEETVRIGNALLCPACKPLFIQKLREGAAIISAPEGLHYANFWIRLAAYFIDQLIMAIIGLPLSLWYQFKLQQAIMSGNLDWMSLGGQIGVMSALSTLMAILYGWLFVGRYAATPGKMLLKIKVVTGDGGRVSYARALGRQGGHIVSGLTCLIGYLLPLLDDQKRALHDHICNTRVIYKR